MRRRAVPDERRVAVTRRRVVRAAVAIAALLAGLPTIADALPDPAAPAAANLVTGGPVDPFHHSTVQRPSYGVQSRLDYRALVVEDAAGNRVALVKSRETATIAPGGLVDAFGEVNGDPIQLAARKDGPCPRTAPCSGPPSVASSSGRRSSVRSGPASSRLPATT